MKFKLSEIMAMKNGLLALNKLQLPIRISYKISKLSNLCGKEMAIVEEARIKAVKKYSVENSEKPGEFLVSC